MSAWHALRICSPALIWCELGALLTLSDLVAAGDYLLHSDRRMPALASKQSLADAVARIPAAVAAVCCGRRWHSSMPHPSHRRNPGCA